MLLLEKNKQLFINRANKHRFNSVIIPTSLQLPVANHKHLFLHKINTSNKIKHNWYKISLSKQMNQLNQLNQIKQLNQKKINSQKNYNTFKVIINNAKFSKLGINKLYSNQNDATNIINNEKSLQDNNNNNNNNNDDSLSFTMDLTNGKPDAPQNLIITPDNNAIIITFTEPYSKTEIVNYLYSIDWSNFEPFDPVQNKSPVIIKNIENGESYVIALKAENKYGLSDPSLPVQTFTGLLGFEETE